MKNGWNDNWVTNLNVSDITKFINSSVLTFHCSTRQSRSQSSRGRDVNAAIIAVVVIDGGEHSSLQPRH
jgi:hypothetical protein